MKRPDLWTTFLALYALIAVWQIHELVSADRVLAEIDMPAIVVERTDPFPCLSDPLIREACDRQGCECRGGER